MATRPRLLASATNTEEPAHVLPASGNLRTRHALEPSPQLMSGAVCLAMFLVLGLAMHGAVSTSVLRDGQLVGQRAADPRLEALRGVDLQVTFAIRDIARFASNSLILRIPDWLAGVQPWTVLILAAGVVLWRAGDRRSALVLFGADATTEVAAVLAKVLLHPYSPHFNGFQDVLYAFTWGQYPSGHLARVSLALCLVATLIGRRRAVLGWPVILIGGGFLLTAGAARVVLQAHQVSGVIGGVLLGCGLAVLALAVLGRIGGASTRG
jgi:membrane-associated phospholipid phosphatase